MLLIEPPFFCKYTGHLLRCLVKSVHPCTLLTASFSIAETSLLIEPAVSVPLLKNPQRVRTAKDGGDSMQNLRVFHTYSFFSYCRYYESYGSIFAEKNRPTSLYRRVLYHRRICL